MKERLTRLAEAALDLLYPPALYCSCCGNLIDESRAYHLCDHCIAHFRWDGEEPREVDGMKMLRCTQYGLYERTLIFDLKYNGKKYLARDIGEIMADRLALAELDFDVIVPVPMYERKERERGFNQAALIGKYLGKRTGKPCWDHCLVRTEATRPMRGLSPTEREENVKGKFALSEKYDTMLEGKRVLLIDDFYTTGSTARACHEALLSGTGGAPASVTFLAFAAK
ncbi:MAG: ComF family protein [Firmicutes bacterium]|nr:ComF family protein [Bacillota bacterium]